MPYSSGTYTRSYNWTNDRNSSTNITASRMDGEDDGFATGLSTCICKDGQSTITADIPWNNKKITGLGDAAADTDALNRQTGDGRYKWPAVTGSALKGTVNSGTVTFDLNDGAVQTLTIGGSLTVALANIPTGKAWDLLIVLTNGSVGTITWPTVQWIVGDGTHSTTFSDMGVTLRTSGVNHVVLFGVGATPIYGKAL